ncbi:amidase [Pseudomonas fluorescens]|uniref:amidase n=1 Tax=Pseudomonas fluorescens TaxID=294 RepID=UPI0017827E69|nr:amidase [Pseudomonas fluorescens]
MFEGLTLVQMAEHVQRGTITSVELVEHYLSMIDALNPALNAIIQRPEREALVQQAATADAMAANGTSLGPLHGVPITIKDVLHVKGFTLSRGVAEFMSGPSEVDATAVARLRQAGAIILGLTNVPELCMSFESNNLLYGRTNNPYDVSRTPGGSSGGEAAAIAAGLSPAGLASDAGGSVRIPAHFTGICSLKLTQGRVPLTGQFPRERAGLFHHTSSFGVMAKHVADLELMGRLIAGPDGHDPDTVDAPWPVAPPAKSKPRVAFLMGSERLPIAASVSAVLTEVLRLIPEFTEDITEACPDQFDEASEVMWRLFITGGDGGHGWKQLLKDIGKSTTTPQLQGLIDMSEDVRPSTLEMKQDWIAFDQFKYKLAAFFRKYDLLITPVYPDIAFRHGQSLEDRSKYGFVFPFSLSGSPAVVLRAGTDQSTGMPIGIQIVSAHWQEAKLLAFARQLEEVLPKWEPAHVSTALQSVPELVES